MTRMRRRDRIRPEIQSLRMIAVLAVVAFHFWPAAIPGGYVGVDVFFVISGYLITSQLLTELADRGRISFSRFYARRARRILPDAIVVLLACLIGVFAFSAMLDWRDSISQIFASGLFFENWALAANSVAYLGATLIPSPVQHYWSLSVEEQFYIVWPAMLAVIYWMGRKFGVSTRRRMLVVALSLVSIASLAYSVFVTATDPNPAFFNTGARVWELGAGALLAYLGASVSRHGGMRLVVSLAGWGLIGCSVFVYAQSTPFPGYAALLPVGGAVLVIWAGVPEGMGLWRRVNDNVVVRFFAETSFAAYLWHWPLLIFAKQVVGAEVPPWLGVTLAIATFILAWLTTMLIERPIRFGSLASHARPRATLAFGVAAVLLVTLPSAATAVTLDRTATTSVRVALPSATPNPIPLCVGAQAIDPQSFCADGPYASIIPNPLPDPRSESVLHSMGCAADARIEGIESCTFGDVHSAVKVALVGDSHAMTMWPAIERLAQKNHWRLVTYLKSSCAFSAATSADLSCVHWRRAVAAKLESGAPWKIVFTVGASEPASYGTVSDASFRDAWKPLVAAGARVVVVRDNPQMPESTPECVEKSTTDFSRCNSPRAASVLIDPQVSAAKDQQGVDVVDLTKYYCTPTECLTMEGGIVLYRNSNHLNDEYTRTLAPYIQAQLAEFSPSLVGT